MAITISGSGITSANIADGTITTDDILASDVKNLKSGRKNLIINGGFNVSQRGDYTTATTAADNVYYLDRFKAVTNGASATVQHINNTTYNSLKMTATSTASGTLGAISFLEEFQKGKTLTASVRMKSNNSNARVLIYDGVSFLATSSTHTGDGSEEIITATGVVSTSATLLRVYTTISTAGVGAVSITSGDYIEIAEVQLEVGSVATDFEHRSYGEELALCQRYYFQWSGSNISSTVGTGQFNSTTSFLHAYKNPVAMRVVPTGSYTGSVNVYQGSTGKGGGTITFNTHIAGGRLLFNGLTTSTLGGGGHVDISTAVLKFDAEL